MKKGMKRTIILLLFLVYSTLLFGCKNNEEPNVDDKENPSNTLENVLEITAPKPQQNTPPREICEYSYELYVSGSDEEVAQVITSTKELKEFLDNKNIKKNIALPAVPNYLGKLRNNYGDRFFKNNNLIICISKRKDLVLYGDISRVYGNNEQIEILFEEVKNKDLYKSLTLSSSVVFEVSKDICNKDTAVSFMLREKKEDSLTFPSEWISQNLNSEYNTSAPKYYPDRFYNISILGFLCDTDKIDEYLNNVFWKEYNGLTPPIYMLIRYLNVDYNEFLEINNKLRDYNFKYGDFYPVYDYSDIGVLFAGNELDVRKKLCKNNYVYCSGAFYDFMDSDMIIYKDQAHTFKEWCWIFFEDMELYDEFLCYADSKAYARFRYELLKEGGLLEFLGKDENGNYIRNDEAQKNFTVLSHRIEYGNSLINSYAKKGEISRYYNSKIINSGFSGVFFRIKEVGEYFFNNFLYKTNADELDYLPTAYYLIRDMNLKSRTEEFRKENEYRITTTEEMTRYFLNWKEFELLFGDYDEDTLRRELKNPTVLYFGGKLYDLEDLQNADSVLLDKLGASTEFKDYLTDLKKMRVFKESEEVYGSLVDGWLEKYYGRKA